MAPESKRQDQDDHGDVATIESLRLSISAYKRELRGRLYACVDPLRNRLDHFYGVKTRLEATLREQVLDIRFMQWMFPFVIIVVFAFLFFAQMAALKYVTLELASLRRALSAQGLIVPRPVTNVTLIRFPFGPDDRSGLGLFQSSFGDLFAMFFATTSVFTITLSLCLAFVFVVAAMIVYS